MKKMYPGIPYSPETELTEPVGAAASTIRLADSSVLPPAPNIAVLGSSEEAETIFYGVAAGNELQNVQRGIQENGQGKEWAAGTKIARYFTEKDHTTLIDNITALKSAADILDGKIAESDIRSMKAPGPDTIIITAPEGLQSAIDGLPRYLDRNFIINMQPGSAPGEIRIADFAGSGAIFVNGSTLTAPNPSHTTHNVGSFLLSSNSIPFVQIHGFTCGGFRVRRSTAFVRFCRTADNGTDGIWAGDGARVQVRDCLISNKTNALRATEGGVLEACRELNGTGNTNAFRVAGSGAMTVESSGTANLSGSVLRENTGVLSFDGGKAMHGSAEIVSISTTMANLQNTIDRLPRELDRRYDITVSAGTITDEIIVEGFYGPGRLDITGSTSTTANPTHTTHNVGNIFVNHNTLPYIYIRGFTCTRSDIEGIRAVRNSGWLYIRYMRMISGTNTTAANKGILCNTSTMQVLNSVISNKSEAIFCQRHGHCTVEPTVTGTGNAVVYVSSGTGMISASGSEPLAGTVRFSYGNGGMIFSGGHFVSSTGLSAAALSRNISRSYGNLNPEDWIGENAPFSQTITVSGVMPNDGNDVEISLRDNANAAAVEAWDTANVKGFSQALNSVTVRAWGEKPTVTLPVRIKVVGA
jgi:hypothetical protein